MPSSSDRRLVAGLAVLAWIAQTFASGRLALAPAVFAAPFFALQVIERTRSRVGVACVFVVQWAAFVVQWRGYILAPLPVYVAVSLGYSILGLLPYLAHVALAKGRPRAWSILAFPSALALTETVTRWLSPYGSWGATAYALPGEGVIGALAAFLGLNSAAFAVGFVASAASWYVREGRGGWGGRGWEGREHRRARVVLAAVVAGFWLAGTLADAPRSSARNVRVGGLFEPLSDQSIVFDPSAAKALYGTPMTNSETPFLDVYLLNRSIPPALEPSVDAWFAARQNALVEATEREAIAGARLIVWSEANGVTLAQDERSFVDRVREVARKHGVVVVMTLNVKQLGERISDNKALIIDASGEVLADYSKAHPVPGAEATRAGNGVVPVVDTAVGRLALVICFDADHPGLVRQAVRGRAELLIVPGNDWSDITPYHTAMAAWRARELGLPMVRVASSGESAVFDSGGHAVARQRTVARGDSPMRVLAPAGRRSTLYGVTGDALTAAAALVGLAIAAAHRRSRRETT